jgi:predicted DNA-binding transcriptional regulator YafY
MAVGILDQFKHLDIFKDLEATVDKLEQAIKIRTSTKTAPTHIFFEAIPFYQGTELMPFFLNAIDLKRAVRFQYQSFKSPTVRRHDLHPYFLQEFSHRWYIVGWSPLYQAIMPFALDRIVDEPELLSDDFEIPENFNRDEYFKNTYGITRYSETEVAEVVLSFSTIQAKYFKSKPFHPYSIVSEAEDALVVKMQLVVNFELKRKILGFGSEVKVLQPASLCEEIKQLHIASHAQYE